MARTTLLPAMIATGGAGLVPALVAADSSNGMFYPAKSGRFLWVKNANAGTCTVTLRSNLVIDGDVVPDNTVVVPATTGERLIGPLGSSHTQADGSVYVDFSISASVTVGIVDVQG
jgi:hypothetical protein